MDRQPVSIMTTPAMTMAIDIDRFIPRERFSNLIDEHIRTIRDSKKAEGHLRIYLPGEIEAELEQLNRNRGVAVDPPVAKVIDGLLEQNGLSARLGDGKVQE